MNMLFGLFLVVALLLGLAWLFSQAKTPQARQSLRIVLGLLGLIAAVALVVRGLAIAGIPLGAAASGLLALAMRGGLGLAQKGREQEARPPTVRMSRKEAADLLGVSVDASEEDIHAAYRKLMKRVHPDAGGNDALASKVKDARDILLGD